LKASAVKMAGSTPPLRPTIGRYDLSRAAAHVKGRMLTLSATLKSSSPYFGFKL